jgi:hypothetical protein
VVSLGVKLRFDPGKDGIMSASTNAGCGDGGARYPPNWYKVKAAIKPVTLSAMFGKGVTGHAESRSLASEGLIDDGNQESETGQDI